ncbi:MAG: aldehyde dehydrogenase family protein [Pseudolabrys sp.]|nr:aldehyde dehydrogenase family protein [Pseudolabrys sp.]
MLIGGEWHNSVRGKTFTTLNPATEEVIAEVAEGDASDIEAAVQAARGALTRGAWPAMTGAQRGRILYRLAAILRERSEEVVALESLDGGKPLAATRRMDLPAAIDCLEYYAGWADKITGEVVPARRDAITYVQRVPVGVVGVIVPWNFALMNAVWKIAPALACGCTIVLKPAELTPLSALWLGAAALEAGLPPGVLNIVPGYGTQAGAALVSHPGIDKISFTGSPRTGQFIMRAAAENITKIGLELGGKSASVVFADANLDSAVRQTGSGAFFNAGQVCSAATRVVVDRKVHDEFVEKLAARANALRIGDPRETDVNLGPVISSTQMQRVLDYIAIGKGEGAQAVAGGARLGGRGYFVQPTVFAGVKGGMRVAQEEIFGPVVSVLAFDDEDEAVSLANGTAYSLAAAAWTKDIDRAHRMIERLRAGTVWVNTYGPTDARLPWGGMGGQSGIGRDLGRSALDNYTEQKAVWIQRGG